jgi:hypothetical protein
METKHPVVGSRRGNPSGNSDRCFVLALCVTAFAACAQPINDNFAHRTVIQGRQIALTNSLSGASSEAGEPLIPGVSTGQTCWWTWTAPGNGIVTLSAGGTAFNPLLTVYNGNDLADLSLIASNNYVSCYTNCGCHWLVRDHTTFHVAAGQVYQIGVDSALITTATICLQTNLNGLPFLHNGPIWITNVLPGGPMHLELNLTPAPKNDDLSQALKVSGSRLQIRASNAGATSQPGEPSHLRNPGGSSVWYSWTAPASGRVTISTNPIAAYAPPSAGSTYGSGGVGIIIITPVGPTDCGIDVEQTPLPAFFPVFAAYTGSSIGTLAPAGCLPLSLDAFPHAICFDVVKGQTYRIAFDGNMGTTGDTWLCLALTKPASNDSFQKRIKLHGIYALATSYNAGATHQPGEPEDAADSVGKTVWWSWTAPVSGIVSIDLKGSDYAFPLAIYTSATLPTLQLVATDLGGVAFSAIAGQTYQIAVSDASGLTGAITLKLEAPVVDAPLLRAITTSPKAALLRYGALAGQTILLLRCNDGTTWRYAQTAVARGTSVDFLVHPAPTDFGPYYQAIVVDRIFH